MNPELIREQLKTKMELQKIEIRLKHITKFKEQREAEVVKFTTEIEQLTADKSAKEVLKADVDARVEAAKVA